MAIERPARRDRTRTAGRPPVSRQGGPTLKPTQGRAFHEIEFENPESEIADTVGEIHATKSSLDAEHALVNFALVI